MPQIRIITSEKQIIDSFQEKNIGKILVDSLEEMWPIARGEITFTLIQAMQTYNECDIQLELHYSPDYSYFNNEFLCPSRASRIEALERLGSVLKNYFTNDILASIVAHGETLVIPYNT